MLLSDITIGPLLSGAFLGIYVVAILVVLAARQKRRKAGHVVDSFRTVLLMSVLPTVALPGLLIVNSGAYRSAVMGAIGGALVCASVLVIFGRKDFLSAGK